MVDDEPKRQEAHNLEILKLCFDYFKHLTTLTTAAALVELALYEQLTLSMQSAILGVGTLGLTLLLCIIGMARVSVGPTSTGEFLRSGRGFRGLMVRALMVSTALFFVFGVMAFALAALNPDINRLWHDTIMRIISRI